MEYDTLFIGMGALEDKKGEGHKRNKEGAA